MKAERSLRGLTQPHMPENLRDFGVLCSEFLQRAFHPGLSLSQLIGPADCWSQRAAAIPEHKSNQGHHAGKEDSEPPQQKASLLLKLPIGVGPQVINPLVQAEFQAVKTFLQSIETRLQPGLARPEVSQVRRIAPIRHPRSRIVASGLGRLDRKRERAGEEEECVCRQKELTAGAWPVHVRIITRRWVRVKCLSRSIQQAFERSRSRGRQVSGWPDRFLRSSGDRSSTRRIRPISWASPSGTGEKISLC